VEHTTVIDLDETAAKVAHRCGALNGERALLVGLSGIDGSGKGFVAARLRDRLEAAGLRIALLNVDGWLNLPSVRFSLTDPAGHFYRHGLRLDEMFAQLVLPLRDRRGLRLEAEYAKETATAYRPHLYAFHDVDAVLLEGIFIYKRAHRPHFDLAYWIDCSFDTALERALRRAQEGLPPAQTIEAYRRIYFPAQGLHESLDQPRGGADGIILNDPRLGWSGVARV
jgi:uridine kinase